MLNALDNFFMQKQEPLRSCLLFLRAEILALDPEISESLKYGMPFYFYKGKRFCYLWVHKNGQQPYIGFVDGNQMSHPLLIEEKRKRMKILMFQCDRDIPVDVMKSLLIKAMRLTVKD